MLRTTSKRLVPVVALTASIAMFATACSGDDPKPGATDKPGDSAAPSAEKKESRKMTVWAGDIDPITMNFNPYTWNVKHAANGPILEPLFAFNKAKQAEPKPMLGTEYSWNDDGTELTFKIRTDVKWNDGKPFTVEDVIFTFTNETGKPHYLQDAVKVDDSTVKLTFKDPAYAQEFALMGGTVMLPKHVWEGVEDKLAYTNENPVGTGPYKLDSLTSESYTIKARDDYWGGKVYVPEIQYLRIGDNNTAQSMLAAGTLDWTTMFIAQPDSVTASGNIGYINTPIDPTVLYTCSNVDLGCEGPQTDVAVRQALNLLIDRTEIKEKPFAGVTGTISPTFALLGRDDRWIADGMPKESPQTADVAGAQKVLEDAGYAKGDDGIYAKDGKRVSMLLQDVSGWSDYNAASELIVGQAKAAGIEIKHEMVDWNGFAGGRSGGKFQLIMGGVIGTSIADPFQIYRDWFTTEYTEEVGKEVTGSKWNFARYSNKVVDDAVKAASSTNDEAKKLAEYAKIQAEITRDLPYIPLVINGTQTFYNQKDFQGWPTADNLFTFPASWGALSAGQVLLNLSGK